MIIALIIAIVSRRAWTSISALALSERGYGQNSAARERADELIAQGYTGYLSGHTHHPELHAHGDGFYGNTGSCTSVVEAIETVYGMPPVYLRTQQLSWLEVTATPPAIAVRHGDDEDAERGRPNQSWHATLKSARVELPGATRFERFLVRSRNPHATAPRWSPPGPRARTGPRTAGTSSTGTSSAGTSSTGTSSTRTSSTRTSSTGTAEGRPRTTRAASRNYFLLLSRTERRGDRNYYGMSDPEIPSGGHGL